MISRSNSVLTQEVATDFIILRDGSISWRCTKKDCSSWVKTDSKKSKLLSEKQEHEHGAQYNSPALPSSTPLPRTRAAPPAAAWVSVSPASTPATTISRLHVSSFNSSHLVIDRGVACRLHCTSRHTISTQYPNHSVTLTNIFF
ncbi:hypothetical protein J6590_041597 [Homalodisca vitripennis]|nr:hypothetical protein J6590_041597 [Homalodisca vitripennis]